MFSQKSKKYFFVCVSFLLGFLALEGLSRIGQTLSDDLNSKDYFKQFCHYDPMWMDFSPVLGWVRKPGFKGKIKGYERKFDSNGFISADTAQIADTNKPKILFIGDSNTFGMGVPTEFTFVEQVDKSLPDINVINLGVMGYTSYQGYKTLEEYGLKLKPAMIVVSFNFNDRRYVFSKADTDSDSKFQAVYQEQKKERLRKKLNNLYTYRALRKVLKKAGIIKEKHSESEITFDALHARVPPDEYRNNLIKIIELAQSNDIKVILMLLKDNPRYTKYLRTGIDYLDKSRYELAIELFNMTRSHSALSKKYMSKAYKEMGQPDKAKSVLIMKNIYSSLLGGEPLYLDSEYNQIMRDIANKYNVKLVDAGKILDENPADYLDSCHPDAMGHRKIAELLVEHISSDRTIRKTGLDKSKRNSAGPQLREDLL
ncbi:MAG: hypothetical protein AMK71_08325 [Nitrospira bacterium SG8_35_4]|nr:MAG: hypothetical protein AMK71_08325 [Nitrospira bacterium SG8_35_4]